MVKRISNLLATCPHHSFFENKTHGKITLNSEIKLCIRNRDFLQANVALSSDVSPYPCPCP